MNRKSNLEEGLHKISHTPVLSVWLEVTLSGNNDYEDTTTVEEGILALQSNSALDDDSKVVVNNEGTIEINVEKTISSLS